MKRGMLAMLITGVIVVGILQAITLAENCLEIDQWYSCEQHSSGCDYSVSQQIVRIGTSNSTCACISDDWGSPNCYEYGGLLDCYHTYHATNYCADLTRLWTTGTTMCSTD